MVDLIDKYTKNIQIPRDYANHIVYGGILGLALLPFIGSLYALIVVFIISVSKINNNICLDGNRISTGNSAADSNIFIYNCILAIYKENIVGTDEIAQERNMYVGNTDKFIYADNTIVKGKQFSSSDLLATENINLGTQHLPVADPTVTGQLWSNNGVISISGISNFDGTFTNGDSKTVTVVKGIITGVV